MQDKSSPRREQGGRAETAPEPIRVEGIVTGGLGFYVDAGRRVHVPGGLPGDRVRVGAARKTEAGFFADILETVDFGIDRREPPCAHADICGGCQWQVLPYVDQLRLKREMVKSAFEDRGVRTFVPEVLPSPAELRYRDRVDYSFGRGADGSAVVGLHRADEGVFQVQDCLLQSEEANEARRGLARALGETRLRPYDDTRRTGVLRGLVVREGEDACGATLVVSSDKHLPLAALGEAAVAVGLTVHVNRRRSRHAPPRIEHVVTGTGWIETVRSGLSLRISPGTFTQVNTGQADRLSEVALDLAGIRSGERVVDLYCGVGILSMLSASAGATVLGVEISKAAVNDARVNIESNRIDGCRICQDDAEGEAWPAQIEDADVFLINPPRAGIEPGVVERVCAFEPQRIVYVSCNPLTLARDVQRFRRAGYEMTDIRPVDMFPQTVHVEVVVRLERS
ncbi:MAG: 23S rRNA (uracil(1939)-C(5))-methyltransferase RlmD [Gemmatimonadetes bacterium]|nr:23S rRNA (uracil(1939)-C(5))-methyltransferase RlmD [Gemmatimonadota bacterium]|tara:strand:+ start:906 stop:2264 length:1359 start_codon:yes stop_codon:yes gene_type:complete